MLSYVDNGFDTVVKYLTKEKMDDILASEYQHQLIRRIRHETDRERRSALKVKLRAMVPMGYPDHDEYLHYTEAYNAALQAVPEVQREAWMKRHKKSGYRKIEFFRPSGLFMIDVDHCQEPPQQVFTQFCEALRRHQIELKGFLAWASVTASGDGLRLILRGRKGSDIVADQLWLAQLTGLKIDEACKDITRLSFMTVAEDTLYRDDALLFNRQAESAYVNPQLGQWGSMLPQAMAADSKNRQKENASDFKNIHNIGALQHAENYHNTVVSEHSRFVPQTPNAAAAPSAAVVPSVSAAVQHSSHAAALNTAAAPSAPAVPSASAAVQHPSQAAVPSVSAAAPNAASAQNTSAAPSVQPSVSEDRFPATYHGFRFEDILRTYWLLNNYGHEPVQGDRDTLTYQLACDLRHICGNDFDWLNAVIPCYDGFPQAQKEEKIRNALASTFNAMPTRMNRVLEFLEKQAVSATPGTYLRTAAAWGADGCPLPPAQGAQDAFSAGAAEEEEEENLPPQMPEQLPPLIALLLSRTPRVYQPAVAHAVFPSLAAHLHKVNFRYIDNVLHEATLMNVLMAGTGAGKDCITAPINYIMADIRERDAENLRREREWKNEINAKGANKDKRMRPEGLVIQEIDADMTNPAFVMRTAEADAHFLYSKLNEIDQFDALKGTSGQQFRIMCLAFDPGNRYGQTRVGAQSITEKVTIRFNWNASTTILKGKRYFRNVLTDGPVSRINFCTIPEREIGAEMPVYGLYDDAFAEQLKPSIEQLCTMHGTVDCPEAFALAQQLREECADQARLSQSRVYENLSFRALVIAWLKGCVLYVANGCRWDPTFNEFVRWSLHYDLWCKMAFFGDDIEKASQEATASSGNYRRESLLNLLPEVFTLEDALALRRRRGLSEKGGRNMVNQWVSRKYVRPLDNRRFEIVKKESGEGRIK